jgi:hypothetical protein
LIRIPRRALALLAGFIVVAGACSGASATLPGGKSGPGGSTGPTVNPQDPSSIITQVISGGPDVKSFHIKIEVKGTIKGDALSGADSSLGALSLGDIKLDGTAVEGDVDVANQAAHLTLTVPPILALGNVPITGDVILKDAALYYKVDLLGPKYTKTDLGSLTSGLPVAVPTPGASGLAGVQDQVNKLRQQLDDAGVKATLVGVEKVGGKDAYHISLSVPIDKLNEQISGAAASAASGMKIDSASVDFWVYKDSNLPAKVEIKAASSSIGNLDLIVTVTDYDKPVTVTAPPASQIATPKP